MESNNESTTRESKLERMNHFKEYIKEECKRLTSDDKEYCLRIYSMIDSECRKLGGGAKLG